MQEDDLVNYSLLTAWQIKLNMIHNYMNKRLINNTLNDSWPISYELFISTQMDSIIYRTSCCDQIRSISQHFFVQKKLWILHSIMKKIFLFKSKIEMIKSCHSSYSSVVSHCCLQFVQFTFHRWQECSNSNFKSAIDSLFCKNPAGKSRYAGT